MLRRRGDGTHGSAPDRPKRGSRPPAAVATGGKEARPEDTSADLQAQAADYLANNDVWMFGPNAAGVVVLLDRLEEIGPREAGPLVEAWRATPKADREAARKAARKAVVAESDTERHLQMAREAVGTWLAVAANYLDHVAAEPDWPSLSARVAEAALDALTALILGSELTRSQRAVLEAPWAHTVGQTLAGGAGHTPDVEADRGPSEDVDAAEAIEEGRFGPNSTAVVDMANRLWLLTPEQVARLVGRWQATPAEHLRIAHDMLHDLVDENAQWRSQVRLAQEALVPWLNAGRVEDTAGFLGQTGRADMRKMAGPALADAVAALVLGDLLEPEDAATLYGPWFDVVGAPALPVTQDEEEMDSGGSVAGPARR